MGNLPHAEELSGAEGLPQTEDGYEAARVEEAFALFAERVRALESVAGELRAELRSLRAERTGAARAAQPFEDELWPDEPGAKVGPSPDWISSVPAPVVRPLTVPRIVLEGAVLLLAALFAGLADLSTISIALVMTAAWALVAASEWAAASKRSRWHLDEVAAPLELPGEQAGESTGPWNLPVVEATAVELPEVSESHTVVAPLPAAPGEGDPGDTIESPLEPAARRRLRLPRRRKAEPAADPWEA
jgi:hypothetical protein